MCNLLHGASVLEEPCVPIFRIGVFYSECGGCFIEDQILVLIPGRNSNIKQLICHCNGAPLLSAMFCGVYS